MADPKPLEIAVPRDLVVTVHPDSPHYDEYARLDVVDRGEKAARVLDIYFEWANKDQDGKRAALNFTTKERVR